MVTTRNQLSRGSGSVVGEGDRTNEEERKRDEALAEKQKMRVEEEEKTRVEDEKTGEKEKGESGEESEEEEKTDEEEVEKTGEEEVEKTGEEEVEKSGEKEEEENAGEEEEKESSGEEENAAEQKEQEKTSEEEEQEKTGEEEEQEKTRGEVEEHAQQPRDNLVETSNRDDEVRNREEEEEEEESEEDMEDDHEVMQPLKMYFEPTEYKKSCKISSRCYIHKAVQTIRNLKRLSDTEKSWFEEHPQFKHFFHMPKDRNHKEMGMWMLLLRTAVTEKKNECWFIVNGVPIRYSLREHALISGLYCHELPADYEEMGSMSFVDKHFPRGSKITLKLVEDKLKKMKQCEDRLRMAVLYFLASVIIGKTKGGKDATSIHPFFLRAIVDLEMCKTFPWGTLSFEDNMKEIKHMMDHFKGVWQAGWAYPSFIMPMELLAFEAIPDLMKEFREDVRRVEDECPRMCKTKFKSHAMKGFPLSEINDALGTTKNIHSILVASAGEEALLSRIMDMDALDDGRDKFDAVVDGWHDRLLVQKKTIFFKKMYKSDVAAHESDVGPSGEAPSGEAPSGAGIAVETPSVVAPEATQNDASRGLREVVESLKKYTEEGFKRMDESFNVIHEQLGVMNGKIKTVEDGFKEVKQFVRKELNPAWLDENDICDGFVDISGRNTIDEVEKDREEEEDGPTVEKAVEKEKEEEDGGRGATGKQIVEEEELEEDGQGGEKATGKQRLEEDGESEEDGVRVNIGSSSSMRSCSQVRIGEDGVRVKTIPSKEKDGKKKKKKGEKKKKVATEKKVEKKNKDDENSDNENEKGGKKRKRNVKPSKYDCSPWINETKKKKT